MTAAKYKGSFLGQHNYQGLPLDGLEIEEK